MNERMRITRRTFLAGSLALSACGRRTDAIVGEGAWSGGIVGASHNVGHLLWKAREAATVAADKADVIVVGGGMSGLIAAHRLKQAGRKVRVIELEAEVGGNASSGRNEVSAYPWGAHYVPVPTPEMMDVCALLEEFGLGRPGEWDETQLCHDPDERLWIRGSWQDGLIPDYGLSAEARAEMQHFAALMEDFKKVRGSDGRRAFAIPVDESSKDERFAALDRLTMVEWMKREGYHDPDLHWYVNYGCRDDYGAGIERVSAWAGIHYFASRESHDVLTWPEGNGHLVGLLRQRLEGNLTTGKLVTRMTPEGRVEAIDARTGEAQAWQAEAIVCATPRFIAKRLIPGMEEVATPEYAPWMVANLTIDGPISETWDNVLQSGKSLGYVVATHQNLSPVPGPTVLTWYQPLDHLPPVEARKEALGKSYEAWCGEILAEISGPHPEIRKQLKHLDVWLWGHAMAVPLPGAIHGAARAAMREPAGRIHFAHSDMSGLSIFEEACHWGHVAARAILA
ncbi:MAG: twin-arginine translocation pathway signal [Akkermansiaceae bacterium]|nr:twin-arginine translocation pathway signal [Akkermansiaceae bacterium]